MRDLIKTATALSDAFMPAEVAQREAALQSARSLAIALELSEHPEFQNPRAAAAATALARANALAVEARFTLDAAHRDFSRALSTTSLPETGWGCSGGGCSPTNEVVPFVQAIAA